MCIFGGLGLTRAIFCLDMRDRYIYVYIYTHTYAMNEARLSHLPFWGPSEGFFLINSTAVELTPNETFEFWVKGSGKPLG